MTEPSKGDYEPKFFSDGSKGKDLLCRKKEGQPVQDRAPTETFMEEKIVVIEKIAVKEENIQVQWRSPITILSEDEGYMLEEDESIVKTETRVGSYRKLSS